MAIQPYNDDKLVYDINSHRYLLNQQFIINTFKEFKLNTQQWTQLQFALSDNVYNFIYSFKTTRENYDHMEYELATNEYFREVLAWVLLYQYEYAETSSGDVVQLQHGVNVNNEKSVNIDVLRGELMVSTKGYMMLHNRGLLESTFRNDFDYTLYRVGY